MIIDKYELSKKLAKLKDLMPPTTLPGDVQGVLFKNGKLSAYNLRVGAEISVEADEEESFIIPPKAIELINKLPDGDVSITLQDNGTILIQSGKINSAFATGSADSYPKTDDDFSESGSVTIRAEDLADYVNSVAYAVSNVETRPVYTGILFEADNGELNIVACDGYRAAWRRAKMPGDFKFIIPSDAAKKIVTMGISGDITISLGNKRAYFRSDDCTVYSRLLEGDFLKYRDVFPKYDTGTIFDRKELLAAIDRCQINIDAKLKSPIRITFGEDIASFDVNTAIGKYHEDVSLGIPMKEEVTIGFNGQYLRDAVRSFDCANVEMAVEASTKPITISDDELTAMVLPVRLSTAST